MNGRIFGGFTALPWSKDFSYHWCKDSWLFSIIRDSKKIIHVNSMKLKKNLEKSVYHGDDKIAFGGGPDLEINLRDLSKSHSLLGVKSSSFE